MIPPGPDAHTLESRRGHFDLGSWPVVLLTGALLVAMRLYACGVPLEYDECNFLYVGERLAEGGRLYQDVWDHHPPALYAPFYLLALIGRPDDFAARVLGVFLALIAHGLLYVLCRWTLTGWRTAAVLLLHALINSDPASQGDGIQRELILTPLFLGAVLCQQHALKCFENPSAAPRQGTGLLLACGTLLGLSTIAQVLTGVMLIALAAGWVWARTSRPGAKGLQQEATRGKPFATPIYESLAFIVAPAFVFWAATTAYFIATHRGGAFLDAVFLYLFRRASASGSGAGLLEIVIRPVGLAGTWPLWCVGIVTACLKGWRSPGGRILLLWTLGSLALIVLPGVPWRHYYYYGMLPMLGWTGQAMEWLGTAESGPTGAESSARSLRRLTGPCLAAVLILLIGYLQWAHYLSLSPEQITRTRHGKAMLLGPRLGRAIAQATDPNDRIFVYGRETNVYYYSGRRSATRFLFAMDEIPPTAPDDSPYARTLLDELKRHPPRIVVLRARPFNALDQWLRNRYWMVSALRNYPGVVVLGRRDHMPGPADWQIP
jgi:hypothetical protein